MNVLEPRRVRTHHEGQALALDRILFVSDVEELCAEAHGAAVPCLRVDPADTACTARVRQHILEQTEPGQTIHIAHAVGCGSASGEPDFADVRVFVNWCLPFLKAVVGIGRHVVLHAFASANGCLSSLLDGMALACAEEVSHLKFRSISCDRIPISELPTVLWLAHQSRAARLFLNDGVVYEELLEPLQEGGRTSHDILEKDSLFVVIGGAGGIGRQLTSRLARDFNGRVVVIGRRPLDQALKEQLADARVKAYVQADISDLTSARDVWSYVRKRYGRIAGVFHLGGVLRDGLFAAKTGADFESVLRPKVAGLLNLARITERDPVRFVVAFSSLSGLLGNAGQADYCAANAFVDRFVTLRAGSEAQRWYSINWGWWKSQGMQIAADDTGLTPLDADRAIDAMYEVIERQVHRCVIYDGAVAAASKLLRAARSETSSDVALAAHAAAVQDEIARGTVIEWVRTLVLKLTRIVHLRNEESLFDHGADSIVAVRVAAALELEIKRVDPTVTVGKAVLLDHPSIERLSAHLIERFPRQLQALLASIATAAAASSRAGSEPVVSSSSAPAVVVSARPPASLDAESAEDERASDIAIVGVAGEFPDSPTLHDLWQLLAQGRCAVKVVPASRWDWRVDYDPDRTAPGRSYGRHGGFVAAVRQFDARFFRIAPGDALRMDPQERRFLQVAYHALEDAGYFDSEEHDVGVFAAAMYGHYTQFGEARQLANSSFSAIANRVSHTFDFHGPSVGLDTMCSGGLTALHLAINAIASGDCKMALAGAVNIMCHPGKYRVLSDGNFLSPTGRCHSFGAEADGYVPGEGTVVLVLKPLARAIADRDRIHGVVKGSAINAVGRAAGFTVPSAAAQDAVIRRAVEKAGVRFADIEYIEAHGTGTALGDPIEVDGLKSTYAAGGVERCLLGSIKGNIGHLESAAGLAGVAKVLLQFRHDAIAPTLWSDVENPLLQLTETPFRLVRKLTAWPRSKRARLAAVSAFGAGGANAHVVLQDRASASTRAATPLQTGLFPVSAKTAEAFRKKLGDLLAWLERTPEANLYALGCTLARGREHFEIRECFAAASVAELAERVKEHLARAGRAAGLTPADSALRAAGPGAALERNLADLQQRYRRGEVVSWTGIYPTREWIEIPNYPFATDEYWLEPAVAKPAQTSAVAALPPAQRTEPDTSNDEVVLLEPVWEERTLTEAPDGSPALRVLWGSRPDVVDPHSDKVIRVAFAAHYSSGESTYAVNPLEQEHVDRVLAGLGALGRNVRMHVVVAPSLFALQQTDSEDVYGEIMFRLAKGIAKTSCDVSLVFLSSGDAEATEQNRVQAYSRLFSTLALERKSLRTVMLEFAAGAAGTWKERLEAAWREAAAAKVSCADIRYDAGGRLERLLRERPAGIPSAQGPQRSPFKDHGVYVIAGGMGSLGKLLAAALVERFDARVVLLGSSADDAGKRSWRGQFGGKVEYVAVDITDLRAMQRCFFLLRARSGEPNGVIHCAGRLADRLFADKTWDEFQQIVAVKERGAMNLDRVTASMRLDFFALFSSVASVFASAGQADYAVGNAFLDRFAETRNQAVAAGKRRGVTLSINWPLWDAGGMSMDADKIEFIAREHGLTPLRPQEGTDLFFQLMAEARDPQAQLVVLHGRREQLLAMGARYEEPGTQAGVAAPDAVASLEERVAALVGEVLGAANTECSPDEHLGNLGFSSVLLQRLATRLEEVLGVRMPPSAFFTYDSIRQIAGYIATQKSVETPAKKARVISKRQMRELPGDAVAASAARPPLTDSRDDERLFAIIGVDGRLPGGRTLDEFWRTLVRNESAIQRVERWPHGEYYAGLITAYDHFDPAFFGLSAREAMLMDPQHRLFLLASYNSLLDAGYTPQTVSNVGVFVGVQFTDYQSLIQQLKQGNHPYAATGNAHAMLANRVSHLMNFHGPSQTIDTACSSAIVALRRGLMALEHRECDYVLVGAASLLLDSAISDSAQSMGVLSPRYRCATFDAEADGYVRGEGVGCMLIKRYADAVRDGDAIHAVVCASAENHGGKANTLTAPNPHAQKDLLLRAYTPELASRVTYVETHGTGTKLGDPIEIDALKAAWQRLDARLPEGRIALGSVKTNVGHLEPAAGIASLFKVILSLKHRTLPANVHFRRLNPYIDLHHSPFTVLTGNCEWVSDGPRVAGISSFGFGGANTHVVLMEAPEHEPRAAVAKPAYLVCLSARSPGSLQRMRQELASFLTEAKRAGKPVPVDRLAYTLNVGREHFEYREAWIVTDFDSLLAALQGDAGKEAGRLKLNAETARLPELDPSSAGYRERLVAWRSAYLEGFEVDWSALHLGEGGERMHLPGYSFDTRAHWFDQGLQLVVATGTG